MLYTAVLTFTVCLYVGLCLSVCLCLCLYDVHHSAADAFKHHLIVAGTAGFADELSSCNLFRSKFLGTLQTRG